MTKASKWTGNILLALVVLALFFFFLGPHLVGISFFTIYSGSMSPVIPVGSVIVVKPVTASSIGLGDIITFSTGADEKSIVTHRVIEIMDGGGIQNFRTAGDANEGPDNQIVGQEDIIGKVWFHVPGLGYLSSFVSTRMGFIWLMAVPALCIILMEIRSIIIELRSMRGSSHWQLSPVTLTGGLDRQGLLAEENLHPVVVAEGAPPPTYPIYMENKNQINLIKNEKQQALLPDRDSYIEPVSLAEGQERPGLLATGNQQPEAVAEDDPSLGQAHPEYTEDKTQVGMMEGKMPQLVLPAGNSYTEPVTPVSEVTEVADEEPLAVGPAEPAIGHKTVTETATPMATVEPKVDTQSTKNAEIETEAARIVAEIVARVRASKERAVTPG